MKRFIIKILKFGFCLFLVAILLDVVITKGLQRVDDYRFQPWTEIIQGGMAHDIVILGNSRAFGHFNPHIIDSITGLSCYNLGLEGHALDAILMRYKIYCEHNSLPKCVVLQIDPYTFQSSAIKGGVDSEQFLPLFYDSYSRNELRERYSWAECNLPLLRYYGSRESIRLGLIEGLYIHHNTLHSAYKGYHSYSSEQPNEFDISYPQRIDSAEWNACIKFISNCKLNHQRVILVLSPFYTSFELDETILNTFIQLSEEENVVLLRYDNNDMCSNKEYFIQVHHLNTKGADLFSEIFATDLRNLFLQ